MAGRGRRAVVASLLTMLWVGAPHASAQQLPRIPVPPTPTASELLATRSRSGDVQAPLPGGQACDSTADTPVALPRDDAAHNDSYVEGWYWYGEVATPDGRELAFLLVFESRPALGFSSSNLAVTDLTDDSFHYERQGVLPGSPKEVANGIDLSGPSSAARGIGGDQHIELDVEGHRLALDLAPTKAVVLQHEDGYDEAYCNRFHFYSRPRLTVTGSLTHDGHTTPVAGVAKSDHMWGFNWGLELVGWEWFTLRLDDGRDIFMVNGSVLKGDDRLVIDFGAISDANGQVTTLHAEDFEARPTRYWTRDPTCRYPVAWDIKVAGMELHLDAKRDAQEVRSLGDPISYAAWQSWATYWDGPATVTGDATGQGWLDLGHYCLA